MDYAFMLEKRKSIARIMHYGSGSIKHKSVNSDGFANALCFYAKKHKSISISIEKHKH